MRKTKSELKPIDKPAYNYWSALYRSFYSRALYIDVAKRWHGLGLLYLLLVIAILSIPFALRMNAEFNTAFNRQLLEPLGQLPTIYIQNGQVNFDKPMPYLIKNKEGQVVTIIDTTGQVNDFDTRYPSLRILINKDRLLFKMPTPHFLGLSQQESTLGTPVIQPFDKNANFVFDGKRIFEDKAIGNLKWVSQLMIYPFVVAILFALLAVFLLVLSLLGQLFSRIFFSFPLTFRQASRLMLVAATPMLLVLIILLATNFIFPGVGVILIFLLTAYFGFAIHAFKSESKRMVAV